MGSMATLRSLFCLFSTDFTKIYQLAYETIRFISSLNINEQILEEFDRLVQLLESPGFTQLRFELLERPPVLVGKSVKEGTVSFTTVIVC